MTDEYIDDEWEFDMEGAGYLEDIEETDDFEEEYDRIFADGDIDEDTRSLEFERDSVTGRKAKRPKMSRLNKTRLSKRELDELFLE